MLLCNGFYSLSANAHCPTTLKSEKACLMLDQNNLFIYNENREHDGPYTDLLSTVIESVQSEGRELKFSKIARGVYRIESSKTLKSVELVLKNTGAKNSAKIHLTVNK
jgi:hypothetical protein